MACKELKERLKSKTPVWFKKIRKISLWLSTTAMALLAAGVTIPGFHLPEGVDIVCSWIIVGGITAGVVSTTAKTDASA